jgi:hypothetical protein
MRPLFRNGLFTLSLAAAIGLAALAYSVVADSASPPDKLANGLERVPEAKTKLAYVMPGTNWSKYKTIALRPLEVPAEARDASAGQTRRLRESYMLGDKEVAALQDAYNKTMRDILGSAGFTFVDTPKDDTLVVAARILKLRLAAPLERTRQSYAGRGRTYSRGGGAMSIAAALADGQTNVVVAEVADHSYGSNMWQINNRVTNMADARQAFAKWARALRDTLKS